MDSMEINKTVAAVLVAGIVFFLSGTIGTVLVHEKPLKQPAIKIDIPERAPASGQPPPQSAPIAQLLSKADPAAGEATVKKVGCTACHTFIEGGRAGVGPNVYGIVGAPHGHMQGFAYSTALKGKSGPWTFDGLNEWLRQPNAYAPGTRMSFAGIKNDQERANVIDYLRTLSPQPMPLPAATKEPAAPTPIAAPVGDPPVETLLATADATQGEAATKKLGCIACHTFTEGGKAGLGPNLYGVVGGPHGHMPGFNYSNALKGKQGPWTYDELDQWLKKPAAYAPGTRMTFVGISNPKERADVIAYLRSLSATPEPLPSK